MLASITRVHAKPYIYVDTITRRVSVVHRVKVSLLTTLASTCYQFLPNTVCLIGENYTRRKRIKVCSKVSKSRTIVYKGNLTPPFYTSFNFLVDTCNCVLKIARSIWIDCFTFTMFRSEAVVRRNKQIVPKVETRLIGKNSTFAVNESNFSILFSFSLDRMNFIYH